VGVLLPTVLHRSIDVWAPEHQTIARSVKVERTGQHACNRARLEGFRTRKGCVLNVVESTSGAIVVVVTWSLSGSNGCEGRSSIRTIPSIRVAMLGDKMRHWRTVEKGLYSRVHEAGIAADPVHQAAADVLIHRQGRPQIEETAGEIHVVRKICDVNEPIVFVLKYCSCAGRVRDQCESRRYRHVAHIQIRRVGDLDVR
jgi:hypothetical protein